MVNYVSLRRRSCGVYENRVTPCMEEKECEPKEGVIYEHSGGPLDRALR